MILSMTAFARCDRSTQWGAIAWELRSVNHRYLDITPRLPEVFRSLEPQVRTAVSDRFSRGKIDCTLRFQSTELSVGDIELDEPLLHKVMKVVHKVEVIAHNISGLRTIDLLRWPGVIKTAEVDTKSLHQATMELLAEALGDLAQTREREGVQLTGLVTRRLDAVEGVLAGLREVLPETVQGYRERLVSRLAEVREQLDPARLEQELVLFAQKSDVEEELDRLGAHIIEVRHVLERSDPVGRRLDFIMQELHREANTLGAKAADIRVTNASLELKVLIEQMREQVQNIE